MFKVMIVDDLEVMRRQIKRLPLWGDSTGFSIADEAEDGQDALEKLQLHPVDLLITDISMPRINGIELLREVQDRGLASCVVFLSEHSEFNLAKEAIQHGIFDYLVKPVNSEELKKLLEKVKKYIEDKNKAQIQIKNLQDKLIEKMEIYYPVNHIDSIIKYISEGNKKAVSDVSVMADDIAAALGHDIMKTAIVLQKAYYEIWMGVKANHEWIEEFVDAKALIDMSLTQCNSLDLMKEKMTGIIDIQISIINRFIFDVKKSPLIKQICDYVIRNIEKEISIGKISETLFLTKNYIGDIFKQETGMTVGEYITMVKMERAKQLIMKGTLKNYEIAHKLAYNDAEYFGKIFKKSTGFSPAQFKTTFKNKDN